MGFLEYEGINEGLGGLCTGYPNKRQILVSWPYRHDFLNAPLPSEVPAENSERLALMKKLSTP